MWRGEWGADGRYHEPGLVLTAEHGNERYVMSSFRNVQELAKSQSTNDKRTLVEFLDTKDDVIRASKSGGASGPFGYLNQQSGWTDAEASMRWLRKQVEDAKRVTFITGRVTKLLFSSSKDKVLGAEYVKLDDDDSSTPPQTLTASLTILAAGSWTPTLLDLRGIVHCTAQPLAYIELSETEATDLSSMPIQLNMSTGYFVIPPPPSSQHIPSSTGEPRLFLKVAQHSYGFAHPTTIPHPEPHAATNGEKTIQISTPVPWHTPLPQEASTSLHNFVKTIMPTSPISTRPFKHSRLCHYADTLTGDFLADYHPQYTGSLFVATGGSGHAFKFLPVMGDSVVQCLVGNRGVVEGKWRWREGVGLEGREDWEWGTEDGSRGLVPVKILSDD